jgi:Zn finger protein HypA/HybF involved in hydrogenase expression
MNKAGYLSGMALSAFCTTCQRTVYVEEEDTPVCPVCSSPLLETVDTDDREEEALQ